MAAASQPHPGNSSSAEFSGNGRRLPDAPDGASSHLPVKPAEMEALSARLEKLSAWALDVRRLPSGRMRADLLQRQPAPPKAGTRIGAEAIRPSVRARKLASALHGAHTVRQEQQVQAVAAAMQQPVQEASKQIIGRMAELENTLVPKLPRRKPPSHLQSSGSSEPATRELEIGELDRSDLSEDEYREVFVSPRTALFRGFDAAGVVAKMKRNHEATKGDRTLWIGGIPDYIAGRDPCTKGLEEELKALLAPFGKLEFVKGRYKPPGAEATRLESWMGGSWGLVTFATKEACANAKTQGVRVPIKEPSCSETKQPVETGCLMIKMIDNNLAAQSPIGRLAAEQHVARLERALHQYKHFFPQGHPAIARLNTRLAQELRKVGRVADAKHTEQKVVSYARSFSTRSNETFFEQDVNFLAKVLEQQESKQGSSLKKARSKLDSTGPRPSLTWVDQ